MKKWQKISLIGLAIVIVIIAVIVILSQSKNNSNGENGLFNSSQKSSAKLIEDNSTQYYGATVTNYQANGITDWKIFHSDGTNIYLISSNYVPISSVPKTRSGGTIKNLNSQNMYTAPLNSAISDTKYTGSDSILSSNPARKWMSYLDTQSSTQNNMKAVAYLMDTEQWSIFKDNVFSEYAIGGPTLDLFVASYNKIHNEKMIETQLESNKGYKVKWATDENYYNIIKGINTSESLYVINDSEAYAMYLAAPSATGGYGIMGVNKNGNLESTNCTMSINGFRPIVCLKSNTQVVNNNDGSVTLK